MRSTIGRVMVAVIGACVLGAVATASASALGWYENEKAVTESKSVNILSSLWQLEDRNPPGGTLVVKCSVAGKGTVAPEGKGTVTELTFTKCEYVPGKNGGCENKESEKGKTPVVGASNLPWKTTLAAEASTHVNVTTSGGTGNPGWHIECKTILGPVVDTCSELSLRAKLFNLASGVEENMEPFLVKMQNMDCKTGGGNFRVGAGYPKIEDTLKLTSGAVLSVN